MGSATPNPAGDRVAYLESSCPDSCDDSHIVIRSLRGGPHLTIGSDAAPCHWMSAPSWSQTGSHLTFTFAASSLAAGAMPLVEGDCPAWHLGELAVAGTPAASAIGETWLSQQPLEELADAELNVQGRIHREPPTPGTSTPPWTGLATCRSCLSTCSTS